MSTEADKEHLHHRLMDLGHGQRRSVAILWLWTALLSGLVLYPVYTDGDDGARADRHRGARPALLHRPAPDARVTHDAPGETGDDAARTTSVAREAAVEVARPVGAIGGSRDEPST